MTTTRRGRRSSGKRRSPVLRRGTFHSISLDPSTEQRIAWCRHVGAHLLDLPTASAGAIVRRAVEAYTRELEQLLDGPQDDANVRFEQLAMMRAMDGDDLALEPHALTPLPLVKLSAIVAAHRKAQPTPMDWLRADLARMRGEATGQQQQNGEHDDGNDTME